MDNKRKLGKRIKELRKAKGYTQEQLAELIDMEQNTISVIESGRNFPTLTTLEKIANVLNVDLPEFFQYEYLEDIEMIKTAAKEQLENMNENQLRTIFKCMKNIV